MRIASSTCWSKPGNAFGTTVVQPVVASWGYKTPEGGEPVADGFNYRSDNNDLWLEVDEMRDLIKEK